MGPIEKIHKGFEEKFKIPSNTNEETFNILISDEEVIEDVLIFMEGSGYIKLHGLYFLIASKFGENKLGKTKNFTCKKGDIWNNAFKLNINLKYSNLKLPNKDQLSILLSLFQGRFYLMKDFFCIKSEYVWTSTESSNNHNYALNLKTGKFEEKDIDENKFEGIYLKNNNK